MVESRSKSSTRTDVTFHSLTVSEVEQAKDKIVAVYAAAFEGPPYNRTVEVAIDFADTLPRHARREAFRMIAARDDRAGQIVGFGYGYTAMPGQWWHDLVAQVMSAEQRERWLSDAFELTELAVLPEYQGYGIGGRVHDLLLEALTQRTAVLSTIRQDTSAYRLYRKRDWGTLLDNMMFPNVIKPYRIMGKEINP